MTEPRALDHVVLPCPDLAAAAARFEAAGFVVSGRNRHPWGTENHVVQLPGVFLELIAPAADYRPLAAEHDAFPFAAPIAGQGSGPASTGMLVWRSSDADADAATFRAQGLGAGRRLDFGRVHRGADGVERTVSFSLAFAQAAALGGLGVFTCQQHHPENFWAPAMQRHGNGAFGVRVVRVEANDPETVAAMLAASADASLHADGDGAVVPLAEATRIEVVRRPGARARLAALVLAGPRDAALPHAGDVALSMTGA